MECKTWWVERGPWCRWPHVQVHVTRRSLPQLLAPAANQRRRSTVKGKSERRRNACGGELENRRRRLTEPNTTIDILVMSPAHYAGNYRYCSWREMMRGPGICGERHVGLTRYHGNSRSNTSTTSVSCLTGPNFRPPQAAGSTRVPKNKSSAPTCDY